MFATNKYASIIHLVEEIANNDRMGTLQRRAKGLLK